MCLEDLVEETLEEFLLECVGNKVEEVSQLPAMLDGIEYLMDKDQLIAETDDCEMLEVGDSDVLHCYEEDGKLHIIYTLDYILQTFVDSEFIWRIQGTIKAELSMPVQTLLTGRNLQTKIKALKSFMINTKIL